MSKSGRIFKRGFVVAGVAVLVVGVKTVYSAIQDDSAYRAFVKQKEAGMSVGMPTNPRFLIRKVQPKENAAPMLAAAFALTPAFPVRKNSRGQETTVMSVAQPGDAFLLDKAVENAAMYFSLLESAASLPDCQFDHTYEKPFFETFPEFANMKQAVKWLSARAYLRASKGDISGAFEDLETAKRIGNHAGRTRITISQFVSLACRAIVDVTAINILYDHSTSDDAVTGAYGIAKDTLKIGLPDVTEGEWSVYASFDGSLDLDEFARMGIPDYENGKPEMSTADMFRALTSTLDQIVLSRAILSSPTKTLSQKTKEMAALEDLFTARWPKSALGDLLRPSFSLALKAYMKQMSTSEMLAATASVYSYRNKNGAFPTKLSDAMSNSPTDYWVDRPVRYRPEGEGFIVWTCGLNGKDDNGLNGALPHERLDQVIDMTSPDVSHYRISSVPPTGEQNRPSPTRLPQVD